METIGKYEVHELASKLPMMSNNQYNELKESIKNQGLMYPIVILSTKEPIIIDGRNRLKVCLELHIKPEFITLSNFLNSSNNLRAKTSQAHIDKLNGLAKAEELSDINGMIQEVILIQNVIRRQICKFSKFRMIKAFNGYPKWGTNQYEEMNSVHLLNIADQLGCSEKYASMMNTIDKEASEGIIQKLLNEEISIKEAYNMTKKKVIKKVKKPDWFDQNVKDEFDRYALRQIVKIKKEIEKKFGIIYLSHFVKLSEKYDHLNYKESWKE